DAEPLRVVAPLKMEHPGILVDSIGELAEKSEVLGLQVQAAGASSEEEALVTQIPLGVLAAVADPLGLPAQDLHRERILAAVDEPADDVPGAESFGVDADGRAARRQ